jgi:hypothetical protein
MLPRTVTPELLDSLPHDDPAAVAGRQDLRRLNALMGNFRWMAKVLQARLPSDGQIVELGAGDGELARMLSVMFPSLHGRYTALDLAPEPAKWPDGFTWLQTNLWSHDGEMCVRRAHLVIANLFLHHLDDAGLMRLGACFENASLLIFNEPCRRRIHFWQGRLISPFLDPVTRHDMFVSILAGFRGDELACRLGLGVEWQRRARTSVLGAYRLVAWRKAAD